MRADKTNMIVYFPAIIFNYKDWVKKYFRNIDKTGKTFILKRLHDSVNHLAMNERQQIEYNIMVKYILEFNHNYRFFYSLVLKSLRLNRSLDIK